MKKKIPVALVDDHVLFRKGVAGLLEEFEDIEVCFTARDVRELQTQLPKYPRVRVILMDIQMPGKDGFAGTAWVKANHPAVRVLALSMLEDELAVIRMLRSGASGYLLKESSPADVHRAIRETDEKGFYANDLVSARLMGSVKKSPEKPLLTDREIQFLKLCATEMTYKEIAEALEIAFRTVDNYRESLFEKLGVKSRTGLALYAIREGFAKA